MTQPDLLMLEGRLNGLREILENLAGQLPASACEQLVAALRDRLVPPDHQEDPGAVPQLALVVEAAATQEIRIFLDSLAARRTRPGEAPPRNK